MAIHRRDRPPRPEARPGVGARTSQAPVWGDLATEARHPESRDLDLMSTEQLVALILREDRAGLDATLDHRAEIAAVADWLAETLAENGSVLLAGAGTSGRLAVLEAAECPPTFGTDPSWVRAAIAGGPDAVFEAREGSEDRYDEGVEAATSLTAADLVIGLSASSVTPYTRGVLAGGRRRGARTVLLTCARADGLAEVADLVVGLGTGPEILAGSTRLKAGSATKAALNAITTAAMVQLGKVYENLMVDLRPGSAKLRDRALRIVGAALGCSPTDAQRWLDAADGEVKVAIVAGSTGIAPAAARARLLQAGGHVRRALPGPSAGDAPAHPRTPAPNGRDR